MFLFLIFFNSLINFHSILQQIFQPVWKFQASISYLSTRSNYSSSFGCFLVPLHFYPLFIIHVTVH